MFVRAISTKERHDVLFALHTWKVPKYFRCIQMSQVHEKYILKHSKKKRHVPQVPNRMVVGRRKRQVSTM